MHINSHPITTLLASTARALRFACLGLLISHPALAASNTPYKHITLTYQVVRQNQPFANITETYTQDNGHYQIESTTKGIGVYALLGKRVLKSNGDVTPEGLKPVHFELHQGDNEKKAAYAEFDWPNNTLTMKAKGETTTAPLSAGTQDLLSFAYQFMFARPTNDGLNLAVTTGKKLKNYSYQVKAKDEVLNLPTGNVSTLHLSNANPDAGNDDKEFWLSQDHRFLPVRIIMHDDTGAVIEQTLTSVTAD